MQNKVALLQREVQWGCVWCMLALLYVWAEDLTFSFYLEMRKDFDMHKEHESVHEVVSLLKEVITNSLENQYIYLEKCTALLLCYGHFTCFFYTKYCCFHLISHYSTFDWDLPWQQKTWMVWKRQYLNVKSHKYFRYVAWLILKVMFSAINCCWTKCPVQNWRYCTIATQKKWSSVVCMSLTY